MSISDAVSVGCTIYEILSPPIFRQCGYILFCNSHVSDLKDEIQKLTDAAAKVQHSVDASRSAGEFIHEGVLTWLNNADQRIEYGNRILETNKVGRVLGFVPDPKACHKLGRSAKKAIPDFQKLCLEGTFDNVSYHRVEEQSLIVGASTSSQRNYVALKSRTAVLKFVMEALDDDKIGAIGVYGMGGVGKTTLLKEVENGAKESKKFDGIFSVFISQAPNLTAIRAEIDYRLKRLVSSDASRKTVLILFDDLWKPLDLKDLGVPESNIKLKVKLVMTSRNKHLLADGMSCQRNFSIGELDVEEAWRFFAVLVSSEVEVLKKKPAAVAFLKKCAGLPVSIEALASFWKKKRMNSSSGDLSEDDLKKANEFPDGFLSLELSYNSLEDGDDENKAKLVFRIIGLLNSPKVPILTLIKYMVGLGLFGSSTSYNIVERARMEITRSLRTLQESSLLLESEDSDHVKIHDVVRDVAVGITSREDHALIFDPLKGIKEWSKKKLKKCRAVTLPSYIVPELHKKGWNSPDLYIFVLEVGAEQGDHHVELPKAKDMVNLRVLHLKNAQFTSLPYSINPDLVNLTTLCLDNCCLEDIAVIGKLVTLQVLSLTGSDLAKLPEEIGGLTNLRMLDLSKCSQLVFIESGVLERLTQLEELYLRESFDKWEIDEADNGGKHNASLDELNSMPRLRTLEVRIPDTSKLPQNLPLGDLVQSKVLMGELWDWSGDYNESRTLKLEVKHDNIITEEWFQFALQKTQDLHLEGLDRNMESFHELCRDGFKELKHLHLQNNSSIERIIWSTEWLECSAFTALEFMVLEKMGSLVKICDGRISSSSFSKLKVVRVQGCHKLMSIFSLSLLNNLTELEEIEINDCDMVRQIVLAEPVNDDENEEDATAEEHHNVGMIGGCSNIFFSRPANRPTKDAEEGDPVVANYEINKLLGKLCYLTLINMPEITTFLFFTTQGPYNESMETTVATPVFFNDDQKVSQKPLKYKEIRSTTHLELNKLQRIELIECKKVVHFTNSQVLLTLVNLESLTIAGCESLEDVFDLQGIEPDIEILPKLYELKLRELPELEHIWKKNPKQQIKGCRKLRTVEIYECNKLLYISSSFMCEVMENLTEINVGRCDNMKSIFLDEEGLESASSVNAQLTSLKILVISNCRELKTFIFDNRQPVSTSSPSGLNVDSSADFTWRKKKLAYWCYGKNSVETSNLVDTTTSNNSFFSEKVLLPSLEMLNLSWTGKFEKLWCGEIPPEQSYCKLEYLHVEYCEELQTVIPASLIERLHNLKQLRVANCKKLEVVFDLDVAGWNNTKKKSKAALMLPQLQQVELTRLDNLTHVIKRCSNNYEIVVGFPSLNRLKVYRCNKLINLISTTISTTLLELNSLDITWCSGLLEVIGGGGEEVSESVYKRNVITFPHLTSLSLIYLDSLTCFSSESHRFDFTCLKILKIVDTKSLKKLIKPRSDVRLESQDEDEANTATTEVLFNEKVQLPNLEKLYISGSKVLHELWKESPTTSSFCKLKLLVVELCSSLQNVIPSFMVKRLQNLEHLCISNCDSLQDIFKTTFSIEQKIVEQLRTAELESIGESKLKTREIINIAFTKLTFLKLEGKIQHNNLFLGSYTLEIPSLKKLVLDKINGAAVEVILEKVHLPNLEELEVSSLEITEVWHVEPVYVGSFNKLKRLQVEKCGELVKIIPFFMLKRLQNLEELVVKNCNKLEIVCELIKWLIDSDQSSSKLLACFPPFQKLASIHVEKCECLRSLFSIISTGQHNLDQYEETVDDSIVQLLQLTYLKLAELPKFSHLLFQQAWQFALELPLLKEFLLIGAGDKETVTHKVAFPERLEIQLTYFFGSTSSVVSDIVKALQQTTQVSIIVLLGSMGSHMIEKLKQRVVVVNKEEANDLFDQVVYCWGTAERIQERLGSELGFVYGERDLQGRAERVRKKLLSYIRNKRLLLIFKGLSEDDQGILEAAGIPLIGRHHPKHLKIILFSEEKKEFLHRMGAKLPIIPIGRNVDDRWRIFKQELEGDSRQKQEEEVGAFEDINTNQEDICSFVGPNTIVLNNMMAALRTNNQNMMIGILGPSWDRRIISSEVERLIKEENLIDDTVDSYVNRVDRIQENLKTALGITTTTSETTARECIRQTLISKTTSSGSSNQLLPNKRLLLVLRGIDEEVDLEAVGIPPLHQVDPKFFKIILLSDKRKVLQNMGAQHIFEIQTSEFKYNSYNFHRIMDGYLEGSDFKKLADECGSDDLATLLAKKLKSQGLRSWANAFRHLKESPFKYEDRKKVIASL